MESDTERVLTVLDQLGVEYKREAGGRAKICCPFHGEKDASFTIYDNNTCFCFGCQKFCWHDELIAKLADCSLIEAKKKLGTFDPNVNYIYTEKTKGNKIPNIEFADPVRDFSGQFKKLPTDVPPEMAKFLEDKALLPYAADLGKWRWHPKGTFRCWENQEGICIPYFGPNGEVATFRLRRYDRMRGKFGHPLAPKGVPLQASYMVFDKTKPVYFCEGESDSLSMRAIGRNVICLPGVGAHKQLHSAIAACFDWDIPKLIFCGDNDEAGRNFNDYATRVTMILGAGRYTPQIRTLALPDEYNSFPDGSFKRKDINDFLKEGRLMNIISEFEQNDSRGVAPKHIEAPKPSAWDKTLETINEIFGPVEELPESEIEGIF